MIPRFNNGATMKSVREDTINPMVDKVNSMNEDITTDGKKFKVDHRVFLFNGVMGSQLDIPVNLDPDEFPVRAVVRTFDTGANAGTYTPTALEYNRTTKMLSMQVDEDEGKVFVEFWKEAT